MLAKFRQQMYGEVIRGRKQIDRPEPTVPHLSGRAHAPQVINRHLIGRAQERRQAPKVTVAGIGFPAFLKRGSESIRCITAVALFS